MLKRPNMISPIKIWEASKSILNGVRSLLISILRALIDLLVGRAMIEDGIKMMSGATTATEEVTLLENAKVEDAHGLLGVGMTAEEMIETVDIAEVDQETDAMTGEEGHLGDQGPEAEATRDLTIGITEARKMIAGGEMIDMTEAMTEETRSPSLTADGTAEEMTLARTETDLKEITHLQALEVVADKGHSIGNERRTGDHEAPEGQEVALKEPPMHSLVDLTEEQPRRGSHRKGLPTQSRSRMGIKLRSTRPDRVLHRKLVSKMEKAQIKIQMNECI